MTSKIDQGEIICALREFLSHQTKSENLVTPINMTCYLCNESLGSSLCNYCKSQFPFHDLDDNAFKVVLHEFQHGTISYDTDQIETLFFNPILDQHSSLSNPNSDLDPDLNGQNFMLVQLVIAITRLRKI